MKLTLPGMPHHPFQNSVFFGPLPKGQRCMAFTIDLILWVSISRLGSLLSGFLYLSFAGSDGVSMAGLSAAVHMGGFFWLCTLAFLNFGLLQGISGGTLGKHFCGLEVIALNNGKYSRQLGLTQSWLRTLSYLVSALPLGAGFILGLWRKDMTTLHDRLSQTLVVDRAVLDLYEEMLSQITVANEKMDSSAA